MPIIYTYPTKGSPTSSDLILISDAGDGNATKKATLGTALAGAAITAGTPTSAGTAGTCLLYTSPSPRDRQKSRMPSSA